MSLSRLLSRRPPILTVSVQCGGLMMLGDFLSQKMVEKKEKFDFVRCARFGLIGFCLVGPILNKWFGFLERRIVLKTPALTAAAKVLTDQLIMAPVFLSGFIVLNNVLMGNSVQKIENDMKTTLPDVLLTNYQVWPGIQMINFFLVPLRFRVLFAQSFAVLWNTYLSWKTNR